MFTYQYKKWYIKFGTESEGEAVDYREIMDILSQCGLGAVLLSDRDRILQVNETGIHLLHGEDGLTGKLLDEIAPQLCLESEEPLYANIAFGEYLLRCPTPQVDDLPERTHLVVFRNAADDACHDMLISVMNQITEAVALYDAKGRVYMLNDAVVKMESVVTKDVLGEAVEDILDNDCRHISGFNLCNHAVKIRSVKSYTGNAVINKEYRICKAVIRSVFC